jgi:hypothetical protein
LEPGAMIMHNFVWGMYIIFPVKMMFFFWFFLTFQVSSAHLKRSYRHAPKGERGSSKTEPAGICHLCLAGTTGHDWEDLFLSSKW